MVTPLCYHSQAITLAIMSIFSAYVHIGQIIAKADEVRDAVVNIRDNISNEEWDALIEANPLLEDLWTASLELEATLNEE